MLVFPPWSSQLYISHRSQTTHRHAGQTGHDDHTKPQVDAKQDQVLQVLLHPYLYPRQAARGPGLHVLQVQHLTHHPGYSNAHRWIWCGK